MLPINNATVKELDSHRKELTREIRNLSPSAGEFNQKVEALQQTTSRLCELRKTIVK